MTLESLSPEQMGAVNYGGRHLLVKGAAGTGKSTILAARAAHLIDSGVPAESIIIIAPTEIGTAAIAEQAKQFVKSGNADGLKGYTFQTWCQHLLDTFPDAFGVRSLEPMEKVDLEPFEYYEGQWGGHMQMHQFLYKVYSYYLLGRMSLEDAINVAYFSKGGSIDYAELARHDYKKKYEDSIEAYINYKATHNLYDPIDTQNIVAEMLKSNLAVLQLVAGLYDHILIDDVQEVNDMQYEILESLAEESCLFCVGDETECIYSFLCADYTSIRKFKKRFPTAEVITLHQNFRCTKETLDLASWVLKGSSINYQSEPSEPRSIGQMPVLLAAHNERYTLYDFIADDIKRNVERYGYKYEDHLLIARTNSDLYGPRISLTKRGIPCQGPETVAAGRFLGAHINLLLAPLEVAAHWDNWKYWEYYLRIVEPEHEGNGLHWRLHPDWDIRELAKKLASEASFEDAALSLAEEQVPERMISPFLAVSHLMNKPAEAVTEMRKRVEDDCQGSYIFKEKYQKDYSDLEQLASQAHDIPHFLELVEEARHKRAKSKYFNENCLRISTIHSAKASDAEICYLWDISPMKWPLYNESYVPELLEEKRRILNVAITRAKSKVVILCDGHPAYLEKPRRRPFFLAGVGNLVEMAEV